MFNTLIEALKKDGVINVSEVKKNSTGDYYVTLNYPKDFQASCHFHNLAVSRPFTMFNDVKNIEMILGEYPEFVDNEGFDTARNTKDIYGYLFVTEELIKKYKNNKK